MEKRGYIIDDETKEKIKSGKYQTLNALRKNKYEKLYSQSRAVDFETGEIFTAKQFRNIKRKASALKSAITRRFNRAVEKNRQYIEERKKELERDSVSQVEQEQDEPDVRETYSQQDEDAIEAVLDAEYDEYLEKRQKSQEEEWIRKRREQDIKDKEQAQEIDAGEVIYKQVNDLINAYPTQGSKFLDKALAKEIAKYGRDAVLQGMANAPEQVIAAAQDILYYEENSDAIHTAFIRFFETIIGTTIEDYAEELGEVMDEMTDYDEL
jgi:hypothetical protein